MEIVGLIVVLVIAAGLIFWRIRGYVQAGRSVVETAHHMSVELERHRRLHESGSSPAEEEAGPSGRGLNPRDAAGADRKRREQ